MNWIQSKDHKIGTLKSTTFLCLALKIKYSFKTMNVMD